jgi:hypothetical protein
MSLKSLLIFYLLIIVSFNSNSQTPFGDFKKFRAEADKIVSSIQEPLIKNEEINMINYSTSLLSYYEDSEHYPAHRDLSVFTILTWLWREPKSWQGGEICLPEFDLVHTVENNQSMIFPGSYLHEARAPVMTTSLPGQGRYCLAQFGYVKP